MKQALIDTMQKAKFDNLYTPEYAVTPLLKYLPDTVSTVWECTDFGTSNITKVLKENHYEVITTDLCRGFDFLCQTPSFDFDMIATNPPYSLKDNFLAACYSYGKPFALLLPLTALEGVYRGNLFRQYGLDVVVLDRRVEFSKGSCWFATAWFIWTGGSQNGNHLYFEQLNKEAP